MENARPPKAIAVIGATASGKTDISLELAEQFDGEIISVDSRQVYRKLDIGTAKATRDERARIPHHLIDVAEPTERFSASRFSSSHRRRSPESFQGEKPFSLPEGRPSTSGRCFRAS